jgi:hypothetical protein
VARKRNAGEGSIFQRADGRWCGQLDLGWQNGRRARKYIYGATAADVQAQLLKARSDKAHNLPVKVERQAVAEYLQRWLAECAKPATRPRTFERYEQLVRLHISRKSARFGSKSWRRPTFNVYSMANSPAGCRQNQCAIFAPCSR